MAGVGTGFEVMRPFDEALVEANDLSDLGRYAATLDDSGLKFAEDKKPIVFKCRALPSSVRDSVKQAAAALQPKQAFKYGIVEVHNIPRPDGGVYEIQSFDRKPRDMLTPQQMDKLEALGIGDVDIEFVGAAIVAHSFLAQGVPPRVLVPDSSVLALDATSRLVAQKKAASTP